MIPTFSSPCLGSQSRLLAKVEREGGLAPCSRFTLGDEDAVLARSRPLILDPLLGHPEPWRHVTNLNLRGTIKQLAQLRVRWCDFSAMDNWVGEIIPEVWMMDHAAHPAWYREQGTSRARDTDTKSPTSLDRKWARLTADI